MVVIVDYDTGNLRSVGNALGRLGCEYVLSADANVIRNADRVLLPGVGEASTAMARLRGRGLDEVVMGLTRPVLGICIGMQLMCRGSEEGGVRCMGIFPCEVRKMHGEGLKIPHMGWNSVSGLSTPLFSGIGECAYFYYVHSYAADVCPATVARTVYGAEFSAALNSGNFYGTQFHPEKSGGEGERVLRNFLGL